MACPRKNVNPGLNPLNGVEAAVINPRTQWGFLKIPRDNTLP